MDNGQKFHKVLDCCCPEAKYFHFPNNFSLLKTIVSKYKKPNKQKTKPQKNQPKKQKNPLHNFYDGHGKKESQILKDSKEGKDTEYLENYFYISQIFIFLIFCF